MSQLKITLLTIMFLFSAGSAFSQINDDTWRAWDIETLKAANTAKSIPSLTVEEKTVIQLCNLARTDGKLFSETFLKDYTKDRRPDKYSRSLFKDLKLVSGLPLLQFQNDLYAVAKEHATTSGKRGTLGHQRFSKRYDPLLGKYNSLAENCAYGYESAIRIVLELLIDEKVSEVGHRKNILNPDFNAIGVSIKPHKSYKFNCVMSFGSKIN